MIELKPCPFCGSKAIMKAMIHIPQGYEYTPTCTAKSCAGRISKKWLNAEDAARAWNRRADDGTGCREEEDHENT